MEERLRSLIENYRKELEKLALFSFSTDPDNNDKGQVKPKILSLIAFQTDASKVGLRTRQNIYCVYVDYPYHPSRAPRPIQKEIDKLPVQIHPTGFGPIEIQIAKLFRDSTIPYGNIFINNIHSSQIHIDDLWVKCVKDLKKANVTIVTESPDVQDEFNIEDLLQASETDVLNSSSAESSVERIFQDFYDETHVELNRIQQNVVEWRLWPHAIMDKDKRLVAIKLGVFEEPERYLIQGYMLPLTSFIIEIIHFSLIVNYFQLVMDVLIPQILMMITSLESMDKSEIKNINKEEILVKYLPLWLKNYRFEREMANIQIKEIVVHLVGEYLKAINAEQLNKGVSFDQLFSDLDSKGLLQPQTYWSHALEIPRFIYNFSFHLNSPNRHDPTSIYVITREELNNDELKRLGDLIERIGPNFKNEWMYRLNEVILRTA